MFCRSCGAHLSRRIINISAAARYYRSKTGVYGCRPEIQTTFGAALDSATIKNRINNSNIYRLVEAYRSYGHRKATLDPLGLQEEYIPPELSPERYGISARSQDTVDVSGIFYGGTQLMTIPELLKQLEKQYCDSIAAEFQHLQTEEEREWFAEAFESKDKIKIPSDRKVSLASLLLRAEAFDHFLATKFTTLKRYSGEGGESMMGVFDEIFRKSAQTGKEEIVICMPHRGRLNFLTCMLQYPPVRLFQKVTGKSEIPAGFKGTGDVVSHAYTSVDLTYEDRKIHVSLIPNPSHLEANNPVSVGKIRSKQQTLREGDYSLSGESSQGDKTLCVQVHGDASFSAQGIVAETFCFAECPNFNVGGSVHLIVNNQIGFTTEAGRGRSSLYASDQAKINGYPVLHVNADFPEMGVSNPRDNSAEQNRGYSLGSTQHGHPDGWKRPSTTEPHIGFFFLHIATEKFAWDVIRATAIAMDYKERFRKDVIIDYMCFRKYGHNELDDPSFTQPIMYNVIRNRKSIPEMYAQQIKSEGICQADDLSKPVQEWVKTLNEHHAAMETEQVKPHVLQRQWEGYSQASSSITVWDTGVSVDLLKFIGTASVRVPEHMNIHPTIQKTHIERRHQKMIEGTGLDWAAGEALAFGSLLSQGYNVRISGQDVGRGTFSHRHAMIVDQTSDEMFVPLNYIFPDQKAFLEIANSVLSEEAVLGFEYGMSVDNPRNLVIWEAQFGDFFNGAQSIIDTYVSSGENKWLLQSGLVMLLPHGLDGAGPEHSSCRMERFLQGCDSSETKCDGDDVNIQIVNPTTPAQYFHLLRRQMIRNFRKPLIVVAPKVLLRFPAAASNLTDMAPGTTFRPVLGDPGVKADKVKRVVFCTGKHYYNLQKERDSRKIDNTAVIRLESLCPFPAAELQAELRKYPNAKEHIWSQEEHRNMGAWFFVAPRFENIVGCKLRYVGRDVLGLPAVGIGQIHKIESDKLFSDLFS